MTADPEQSTAQPPHTLELLRDDNCCGNEARWSGHPGQVASLERRSSYLHVPIVQDFEASSGHELTVACGQIVEVIPDRCRRELETTDHGRHSGPGWCFVRLLSVFESRDDETSDADEAEVGCIPTSPPTGYVPMEVLGLAPAASPTSPKESKEVFDSAKEGKSSKHRTPSLRDAIKRLGSMRALFSHRSSTYSMYSTPRRRSNSISQFYVEKAGHVTHVEGLLPEDAENSVHAVIAGEMQHPHPEADALPQQHDAGVPTTAVGTQPAEADATSRLRFPQQPSTPSGLRRKNALDRRRSKSLDHLTLAKDAPESLKKQQPTSGVPSRDLVAHENLKAQNGSEKVEEVMEPSQEEIEKCKRLRRCAVQELVDTERVYIEDLGLVVNDYMEQIKQLPTLPETLQGSDKVVFGNIHQIYDFHRNKFAPMIEKSVENPHHLGHAFQRYGKELRTIYTKYCENKPRSEYVVMENQAFFSGLQQTLNSKPIGDLLIKPVQRFLKYELLLKEIHKNSKRCMENCEGLEAALQVMRIVASAANDMMSVGRLQGFTGNIMQQGSLLHQGKIAVAEVGDAKGDEKAREWHVFLFEQVIIFCEEMERKSPLTPPSYLFKHAMWVNNMMLESRAPCRRLRKGSSRGTIDTKGVGGGGGNNNTTVNDELLPFLLIGRTRGSELRLILQPADLETRTVWLNHINEMLRLQRELTTALLDPQKHMKKLNDIGVGGWPLETREAGGSRARAS